MRTQFPLGQWVKKSLTEVVVILVVVTCLAVGFNFLREDRLPLRQKSAVPMVQNDNHSDAGTYGFYEIGFQEALERLRANSAVFVDARTREAYRQGHIPGAVNLPDQQFDEFFGPFFEEIDPERFLITYCEGEHCPLSGSLAEKLREAGYDKVFVLKDGWGQWKRRELPVEAEKSP
jgi:rhodanese-related sulfurtransferase